MFLFTDLNLSQHTNSKQTDETNLINNQNHPYEITHTHRQRKPCLPMINTRLKNTTRAHREAMPGNPTVCPAAAINSSAAHRVPGPLSPCQYFQRWGQQCLPLADELSGDGVGQQRVIWTIDLWGWLWGGQWYKQCLKFLLFRVV